MTSPSGITCISESAVNMLQSKRNHLNLESKQEIRFLTNVVKTAIENLDVYSIEKSY